VRASAIVLSVVLLAGVPALSMSNEEIKTHLAKMRASERGMMNVAPAEGQYLYELVKKLNAKRVLELGTSNGYSGIWFAMGLRETGGKLITLELDEGRYGLAQKNFETTGLKPVIESRLSDALEATRAIEGPFDLVFIDAWKPDYLRYYNNVVAKVRKGGVIAAHNVDSHPNDMQDFLAKVKSDPAVKTEFVRVGPAGISISVKQ
jgi:predicted O-methyltransferase YrrM